METIALLEPRRVESQPQFGSPEAHFPHQNRPNPRSRCPADRLRAIQSKLMNNSCAWNSPPFRFAPPQTIVDFRSAKARSFQIARSSKSANICNRISLSTFAPAKVRSLQTARLPKSADISSFHTLMASASLHSQCVLQRLKRSHNLRRPTPKEKPEIPPQIPPAQSILNSRLPATEFSTARIIFLFRQNRAASCRVGAIHHPTPFAGASQPPNDSLRKDRPPRRPLPTTDN